MSTTNEELQVRDKQAIDAATGELTREGPMFVPQVDIFESEDAITLRADVPGARKEGIEIDLRDGVLTITASVEPPVDAWKPRYREHGIGGYSRRFTVGDRIDHENIGATVEDGVLNLVLAKAKAHQPRKIDIA